MIDAGLITRDELEECLRMSRETGLPVGRMLLVAAKTSETVLQAAVQAQSLLKDGLIDLDTAYKALRIVKDEKKSFDNALKQLNVIVEEVKINKLGQLLLSSNFCTEEQLEEALAGSASTGLPFGRMLVLNGVINESQLAATLNAQILIRDDKITKDQAVDGLKQARRRQIAVEVPLMEKGFYRVQTRDAIRLGELLSLAGLISESQLLNAVELGLISQKPLGQVLIETNLVSEEILKVALQLQDLVMKGTLRPLQASQVLVQVKETGKSIPEAVALIERGAASDTIDITLKDFLMTSKTVTTDDIATAFEVSVNNNQILGRMLLLSGIIDESTLQAAMRLVFLVKGGILNIEQAQKAFDYSTRHRATIDEALQELNIQHTPPAQA
ncbi:hypothetical protein KF728_15750 [Candidatus Obscuribacterales bacterium]|nr:hypothetical protein [Candidatus Obscuribacterales bacterium]MBX3151608.1 hypothetical protein [Candidatus Obscuribacterales bacterium]